MTALTVIVAIRGVSRRGDKEVGREEDEVEAREEKKKTESLTTRL